MTHLLALVCAIYSALIRAVLIRAIGADVGQ